MINQRRLQLSTRLQRSLKRKSSRKRLIRYSLVAANVLVLGAVAAFVAGSSHGSGAAVASGALADKSATTTNPVDGLTSYDIAANVAHMVDLPESTPIDNQAQSAKVTVAASTSDTNVIAKPQIVATALKNREDIQTYVVQAGDTITSIAQKFGITTDSVKWSNSLSSDTVALGTKLAIPPTGVNGIVYNVKATDTIQSLATQYKANVDQIIAYNDAEISGIKAGEQIIIPNGQIVPKASSGVFGLNFTPRFGGNGYDRGWCTWYVASMIAMPNNWGNASTWAYFAGLSGWQVSSTPPRVGVIAQTTSKNHVAIVEAISDDGTMIKYSDMNGIAGFGRVGFSDWVPVTHFEHYIYQ